MSTKFKVIVKTGNAENNQVLDVEQGGKALRIKAIAGAKYQLQEIDKDTSLAPEVIKLKRVGKSLHILLAGSKDADVIIEDYYEVMPQGYNGIVGQAENGNYYEYLTQNSSDDGMIWSLTDKSEAVAHALGGSEVSGAGAAVGVLAVVFNPLVGALSLVGAGAGAAAAEAKAAVGVDAATALSAISAAAQANNATDANVAHGQHCQWQRHRRHNANLYG